MVKIKFEGMEGRENFEIDCNDKKAEEILAFCFKESKAQLTLLHIAGRDGRNGY